MIDIQYNNLRQRIERILPTVVKPGRYVGGELNQVIKDWESVSTHLALVFPDIYDLGHSNLGLAILYDIGKRGRWIQPEDVSEYIFGYTVANDVTARDLQRSDSQWTRAKGFDTFCPLGPWIETSFDPSDALITCHAGEELRQMASTRDMVFSIPQLVVFISSVMTLEPGDVILTGTPSGVGDLRSGLTVSITIEGLGTLTNPVIDEKH